MLLKAVLLVCCTTACTASSTEELSDPKRSLVVLLRGRYAASPELKEMGASVGDSIKIEITGSRAIPGLAYHWGSYSPPNTVDASVWGVAAQWKEHTRILETPNDWAALASEAAWKPKGEHDVVEACHEVVQTVGPRRANYPRPVLFRDSSTLANAPSDELPMLPASRPSIWSRASRPHAVQSGAAWTAILWVVELGQTTKYQCELQVRANLKLRLSAVDSIPSVGLMTGPPTR